MFDIITFPFRQYSTVGWSDLALFAIFKIGHIAVNQFSSKTKKSTSWVVHAKFSFSKNSRGPSKLIFFPYFQTFPLTSKNNRQKENLNRKKRKAPKTGQIVSPYFGFLTKQRRQSLRRKLKKMFLKIFGLILG